MPSSLQEVLLTSMVYLMQLMFAGGEKEIGIELDHVSHVAAAEAVFAVMYEVAGAITQQDQATLVLMATLADQHDIPRVVATIVSQLCKDQLTTEGLDALLSLPAWPSCLYTLLLKVVETGIQSTDANRQAAVKALLEHVFCDLEEVWTERDVTRRDILVNLPFTALKQLLQSKAVVVASEDTILFTIVSSKHNSVTDVLGSLHQQRRPLAPQLKTQRAELAAAVRLPYLSPVLWAL